MVKSFIHDYLSRVNKRSVDVWKWLVDVDLFMVMFDLSLVGWCRSFAWLMLIFMVDVEHSHGGLTYDQFTINSSISCLMVCGWRVSVWDSSLQSISVVGRVVLFGLVSIWMGSWTLGGVLSGTVSWFYIGLESKVEGHWVSYWVFPLIFCDSVDV